MLCTFSIATVQFSSGIAVDSKETFPCSDAFETVVSVFFVVFLFPRLRSNFRWLMKFTHEFTHLFFAVLFLRKIKRFNVDSEDSFVSYSNGWFGYHLITLAPYFVPLLTLALLPWRFTTGIATPVYLHAIDALIGFSYAFHIVAGLNRPGSTRYRRSGHRALPADYHHLPYSQFLSGHPYPVQRRRPRYPTSLQLLPVGLHSRTAPLERNVPRPC